MSQTGQVARKSAFGPVQLLETEPGTCCAGAWANITVTTWQSRGTGSAVERVGRISGQVRNQFPNGISSVHMIREGAGMPTPEGREGLVKLMNEHAEQIACVAIVIGGSGFWASAIRSLVTGMRAVSTRSYQLRLFGAIDEVVGWLPELHAERTGVVLEPTEFAQALTVANRWDAGPGSS